MMRKEENNAKTISRKTLAIALSMVLVLGAAVGGTIAWLISSTEAVTNVFTPSNIKVTLTEETNKDDNEYKMIPGWVNDKDPKAKVESGSEDCYLFIKITGNNATITENKDKTTDKVTSYNLGDYVVYNIADGWTKLAKDKDGNPLNNVFYRVIDEDSERNVAYSILGAGSYTDPMGTEVTTDDVPITWDNDQVATKPSVTETMMEALKKNTDGTDNYPTLSFTAYASQLYKTNKPDKADGQTDDAYANALKDAQFTAAEAWANIGSLV